MTESAPPVDEPPVEAEETPPAAPVRPPFDRRFWVGLALIGAAGLTWRILYVLLITRYENAKLYDAAYYELQGITLATGHFFPVLFHPGWDAAHPPLTSLVIVPVSWLFGLHQGATPDRLTMAVLGGAVVVLAGVLGKVLAGARVGLVAAFIAAAYPNLWIPNGIVMSETLTMLLITLVLLATYRLLRAPSWGNAVLLGLACGFEMLTRAELVLLIPCLLIPAALVLPGTGWKRKCAIGAVAVLVAGLVVGPWVGRNLATFKDPTFLSTGEGPVLAGSNCSFTYNGPGIGYWALPCSLDAPQAATQSVESANQASVGLRYARHHLSRLPVVMLARIGRVWDFFEPLQMARVDVNEGRPRPAALMGLFTYYLLLPAAALGAFVLRRRRVPIWPLLAVAGIVTVVAATGYGQVRFRAEFEVPLVVLAAVGLDVGWRRLRRRLTAAPAIGAA